MELNWHVLCTKTNQEKRVLEALAKRGIECYCPFINTERKFGTRSVKARLPLFSSYVFVKISEMQIQAITKIPYTINLMYWKSKPVIVKKDEINAVKLIADNYLNIKLEKTDVKMDEKISFIEKNSTDYNKNMVSIKHQGLTVTLPSLGYNLVAERQREGTETTELVKKKFAFSNLLPIKLNPLFASWF